jgi:ribosomal-protein-alanine N-acetyltransferase
MERFPEITTDRLLLRQVTDADKAKVFEGLSRPDMIQYYGVSYKSLEDTQVQMDWFRQIWEEGTGIWWALALKENPGELIGACGLNHKNPIHLNAEIGFWILPPYQGKGLMKEAANEILHYGFTSFGLHRIFAMVETPNTSSNQLLLKLGFTFEGCQREAEWKNGKFIDLNWYGLLKQEFIK